MKKDDNIEELESLSFIDLIDSENGKIDAIVENRDKINEIIKKINKLKIGGNNE